jgi:hypothetical protein
VEHRRESRLNISKNVTLRIVSLMGASDPRNPLADPIAARVVDISGSGIRLELSQPVPCGAKVEISDNDTLVLGEILRCVLKREVYMIAVRVSRTTAARS